MFSRRLCALTSAGRAAVAGAGVSGLSGRHSPTFSLKSVDGDYRRKRSVGSNALARLCPKTIMDTTHVKQMLLVDRQTLTIDTPDRALQIGRCLIACLTVSCSQSARSKWIWNVATTERRRNVKYQFTNIVMLVRVI